VRIYNGIDLDRFRFEEPGSREPTVVGVGRLVEKKGFGHLVDAVEMLAARGRPVRLALIGAGPEEAALRDQVRRTGLADRVDFHGPLPQGRMQDVVRRASVLAAPCVVGDDGNRDGLPTVLLEGLAMGTPCVATPVTGIPEAIKDGETGLLVPEADPQALADALAKVLDDPDRARRIAGAGRRLIEERFDVRRNTADLLRLFRDCSTSRSAPALEVSA
jgi:glycosyltransferase involved in cell wall biosynthesis